MDFNKSLLSVAVSSILLSSCSSSNSSGNNESPSSLDPNRELITSAEKLVVGKSYIPKLLNNFALISNGADAFMHSNGNAENSILSAGAQVFQQISFFNEHINDLRKQLKLSDTIEYDHLYELPNDMYLYNQLYDVKGTYEVIASDEGEVILSYDAIVQRKNSVSGELSGPEYKSNFDMLVAEGRTNAYPQGNWYHKITLDGLFEIPNLGQVTIQDLKIISIIDVDEEAEQLASIGEPYRGTSFHQIDLMADNITVITSDIKTSGSLELSGKLPSDLAQYHYGSLMVGATHANAYRRYGKIFHDRLYDFTPLPRHSQFNIAELKINNLVTERVEDNKLLLQQESLRLADVDPDNFNTAYGGSLLNTKIADYSISEDEQSIKFITPWTSASLELLDGPEGQSNFKCHFEDKSYLIPSEARLTFYNIPAGCFDKTVVLNEKYQTIQSWLLSNNPILSTASYGYIMPFQSQSDIPSSGELFFARGNMTNLGIDDLDNPWLFSFSSKGKTLGQENHLISYDLDWSHQRLFDYVGSMSVDVLGEVFNFNLSHTNGQVDIQSTIEIDRQAISANGNSILELDIDMSELVHQVLNNNKTSYVDSSIGRILIDDELVANLNVIAGNISSQSHIQDYTFTLPNPLLCNAMMPLVRELCLDMEPKVFALSMQLSDGSPINEVEGLVEDVENLVYEESCPEEHVIAEGCNIEPVITHYSFTGVIKTSLFFDALK